MATSKKYAELLQALKSSKLENNAQLNYLFKTMNNGTPEQVQELKDILNEGKEIELAPEQVQEGFDWLKNLWKTPRDVERKNNPYGYREQDVLEAFGTIYLIGYYNAGNRYIDHYVPLYDVRTKEGVDENTPYGFEYYVSGGQIDIVG